MQTDLHYLEIREISELLNGGEVSPVELTELMLDRIDELDPTLQSYAHLTRDSALASARTAEAEIRAGRWRGPLHGVPLGLKDLFLTADAPTTAGTVVLAGYQPGYDATVVSRLRDAGSVLLGKQRMSEAAFADHHPTLPTPANPWDADTWVGASSSGPASATAAGLCYGTLGSDTGGSIRFPSAATGLTGLKPSWGRVSRFGVLEFAGSLDHVGPMARSAYDCALLLQVIAGADPADVTAVSDAVPDYVAMLERPLRPLRIGVDRRFTTGFDPVLLEAIAEAEQVFEGLGATLHEVELPRVTEVVADWTTHCAVESAAVYRDQFPSRRQDWGPEMEELLDSGNAMAAVDFQAALVRRRDFAARMRRAVDSVDLLLLPSIAIASPTVRQMGELDTEQWLAKIMTPTSPFNFSGNPTISLPCGFTERGTPLGFQLVGSLFDEALLLQAGHAYQRVTNFHRAHPAVGVPPR